MREGLKMPEGEKEPPAPPEEGQQTPGAAVQEAPPAPVDEIALLQKQLEEEKQKAESYLANWQRAQADFINYKRRTEQEREEANKFSNAMLILNLLPVLDDLERALATVPTPMAGLTWLDGIRLIYRKLVALLEAHGLQAIKVEGQEFDPNLHEAVMYGEGEEGKVVEELQRGYKLHDRVIRPAMVTVGKKDVETGQKEQQATPPE